MGRVEGRASAGDSDRMQQPTSRWPAGATTATPVLVFPTAGGDAEEIERHHLLGHLAGLVEAAGSRSTPATASPVGR